MQRTYRRRLVAFTVAIALVLSQLVLLAVADDSDAQGDAAVPELGASLGLSLGMSAMSAPLGMPGGGTQADPYQISTPEQLNSVRSRLSAHYKLMRDIDLAGYSDWQPIGTAEEPFSGSIDGQNHKIRNLKISSASNTGTGLIGALSGTLRRIEFADCQIRVSAMPNFAMAGAAAGMSSGLVSGCSVSGSVFNNGVYTGGLVGYNTGTVEYSYSLASVTGGSYTGGIAGGGGAVVSCFNSGSVENTGLSGHNEFHVGGITGQGGSITDCYNTGRVTGNRPSFTVMYFYVAGICGDDPDGVITNAYNIGTVSGYSSGRPAAITRNSTDTDNCYYLIGSVTESVPSQERTAREMMQLAPVLGGAYLDDPDGVNNGFPVLAGVNYPDRGIIEPPEGGEDITNVLVSMDKVTIPAKRIDGGYETKLAETVFHVYNWDMRGTILMGAEIGIEFEDGVEWRLADADPWQTGSATHIVGNLEARQEWELPFLLRVTPRSAKDTFAVKTTVTASNMADQTNEFEIGVNSTGNVDYPGSPFSWDEQGQYYYYNGGDLDEPLYVMQADLRLKNPLPGLGGKTIRVTQTAYLDCDTAIQGGTFSAGSLEIEANAEFVGTSLTAGTIKVNGGKTMAVRVGGGITASSMNVEGKLAVADDVNVKVGNSIDVARDGQLDLSGNGRLEATDFNFSSGKDHTDLLSAGTVTVKRDMNISSGGFLASKFTTSGSNRFVLPEGLHKVLVPSSAFFAKLVVQGAWKDLTMDTIPDIENLEYNVRDLINQFQVPTGYSIFDIKGDSVVNARVMRAIVLAQGNAKVQADLRQFGVESDYSTSRGTYKLKDIVNGKVVEYSVYVNMTSMSIKDQNASYAYAIYRDASGSREMTFTPNGEGINEIQKALGSYMEQKACEAGDMVQRAVTDAYAAMVKTVLLSDVLDGATVQAYQQVQGAKKVKGFVESAIKFSKTGDIFDALTMFDKGMEVGAYCPVDVFIYDESGSLAGRVVDNAIDHSISSDVTLFVDGDEKALYMPADQKYSIELIGTDTGTMDYHVRVYGHDNETRKLVQFTGVPLYAGKVMKGSIINDSTAAGGDFALYHMDGDTVVETIYPDSGSTGVPRPTPGGSGSTGNTSGGTAASRSSRRSSSSSGTGSSSGAAAARTRTMTPVTLSEATSAFNSALKLARQEGASKVIVRFTNKSEISLKVLQALARMAEDEGVVVEVRADMVENAAVTNRIVIDPAKATRGMLLTASYQAADTKATREATKAKYRNAFAVLHLAQPADFGTPVTIASAVSLEGLDTDNLEFYAFDRDNKTYERIAKPGYRIDANGYLRFRTLLAGDIVISDGELRGKNGSQLNQLTVNEPVNTQDLPGAPPESPAPAAGTGDAPNAVSEAPPVDTADAVPEADTPRADAVAYQGPEPSAQRPPAAEARAGNAYLKYAVIAAAVAAAAATGLVIVSRRVR